MTREEAIQRFQRMKKILAIPNSDAERTAEAIDMAIEALQTDIVYCYECKYNVSCCQCVDIIDDLLSLNFCSRGERKEMRE